MAEENFFFESVQDTETIRDFLQSLLEGIENGQVKLSTNGDQIVLKPASLLKFEVKARKKAEKTKLNIKISWKETKAVSASGSQDIAVSS